MTLLVLFGYITEDDAFDSWGADININHPVDIIEVLEMLNQVVNLDMAN